MTVPAEPTVVSLKMRKALYTRHFGADDERTLNAAAALRTALLAQAIRKAVQARPPLTNAEREELAALLLSA